VSDLDLLDLATRLLCAPDGFIEEIGGVSVKERASQQRDYLPWLSFSSLPWPVGVCREADC